MQSQKQELLQSKKQEVIASYESARATNKRLFLEGDVRGTSEYIFPNQKEDANNIVNKFYKEDRRVISIQKKTKIGADGLMIEIAKIFTTHEDDDFVIDAKDIKIITGMSNVEWEKDMIEKAPTCFKNNIFHHGQLKKCGIENLANGLLIIDEIDTGDKEFQVLHRTLKDAGILDVKHMQKNNNGFIFISATMIKELYDLYRWGELHEMYRMTIPKQYIGHRDFLEKGILQEFYALNDKENAEEWVQEDILDFYENDFRVHIVRVSTKTVDFVQNACISKNVIFRNHTSTERLEEKEIKEFFQEPLQNHIVIAVKGFFRRANLIPNCWKLRIGATHEMFTKVVDNNVQVQGLTGRMTGYWREHIEMGYKTGPHRTSLKAIEQYEEVYENPFGMNSYNTAGFKKKGGKTQKKPTMLSCKNIDNLVPINLDQSQYDPYDVTEPHESKKELKAFILRKLKYGKMTCFTETNMNIQYRGETKPLHVYESKQQFMKLDIYWGMSNSPDQNQNSIVCRLMPVVHYNQVKYVGIFLKKALNN